MLLLGQFLLSWIPVLSYLAGQACSGYCHLRNVIWNGPEGESFLLGHLPFETSFPLRLDWPYCCWQFIKLENLALCLILGP